MLRITVLILYVLAMFLLGNSALKGTSPRWQTAAGSALVGLAIVLHGFWLYLAIHQENGLALGSDNISSMLGWLIAGIALYSSLRPGLAGLAAMMLSLATLGVAVSFIPFGEPITTGITWQLASHILLSIAAYSVLGIGAIMAAAIALQDARLRSRKPSGLLLMLPSLEAMEHALFSTLSAGFLLLTLAIFSGLIFVDNLLAQHLAHKTLLSVVAWVVFAVLLVGRWRRGWRGKKAVYLALTGFVILALAYFGTKLVLETILDRQWQLASFLTGV